MSPRMKKERNPLARQRGSMMVEVLVSVLLLSVSVLGLVRVLANSMQDSGELEYRSIAAAVADESIARIWVADRSNMAELEVEDDPVLQLPDGKRTVEVIDDNIVEVTVRWQAPGATAASHVVRATIAENSP
jgi:type IV pilus assembly protein PilV